MVYYSSNLQHKIYGKPNNITATSQDDTLFVSVVKANDHITEAKNILAEILPEITDEMIHAKLPVIYDNNIKPQHQSLLFVTDFGLIIYSKNDHQPSEIEHISYSQISNLKIIQTETDVLHLNVDSSTFTSDLHLTIDGQPVVFHVENIWSKSKYVNLKPLLYHLIMLTQKGNSNAQ